MDFKCELCSDCYPHEHISKDRDFIQNYISIINKISSEWGSEWGYSGINIPWFRGQSDSAEKLIPSVLRKKDINGNKGYFDEFWLSTTFRNRAESFSNSGELPNRNEIDKWLFLMQHVGLPTRLLDWTESALVALYFAVNDQSVKTNPAVWIINPIQLNKFTLEEHTGRDINRDDCFPNTWNSKNVGHLTVNLAWSQLDDWKGEACNYPLAIQATYSHTRIGSQKGCFTVHGVQKEDFEKIFTNTEKLRNYMKKVVVMRDEVEEVYKSLRRLGITHSTIYPDLFGLAKELKERFWYSGEPKLIQSLNRTLDTMTIEADTIEELKNTLYSFLSTNVQVYKMDFGIRDSKYIYVIDYWNYTPSE